MQGPWANCMKCPRTTAQVPLSDLQLPTVVEGVLWTQFGQVRTEDLSDMLKALCIDVILKAVSMRMDQPAR